MSRDERFEAIYRKYYARIYRYFRRCGVADDEAHDLAQETFKRFYESMSRYRGDAEWGFLETTALNILRNYIRARKTQKRNATVVDIDNPEAVELEAPPEPDLADRQEEAMQKQQLHAAIAELSVGQRQCLKLWLDDLQYDEIAAVLRISMDAVRSRLRDARKILSARLGDQLPEVEE
jgi:RNA polymerase sigma-70 factor, ECF subfamily